MNRIVGLDLSWGSIRAVEMSDDLKVIKIGKIDITEEARLNKEVRKKEYPEKIKELFAKYKLPQGRVIINFRGSYVLARTYLPPSTNKDEFERWFVEAIQSIIPGTPITDVVYSYDLLPSGRVVIAFGKNVEIENVLELLKQTGITPVAIDAACLALYDAFADHPWNKAKKDFGIVDIGDKTTDLLIVKNGEPFASCEINYGGRDLIKGREKMKIFSRELGSHLSNFFRFYEEKESFNIRDIILTGEYSSLAGLCKHLKARNGLNTVIGDPFAVAQFHLPDIDNPGENASYAQAIGLARKGLSGGKIDLTPYAIREKRKVYSYYKKIHKIAQAAVLIGVGIIAILFFLLFLIRKENKTVTNKYLDLNKLKTDLSYIDNEQAAMTRKILMLKNIYRLKHNWSEILYNLSHDIPVGLYFTQIRTDSRLISNGTEAERKLRIIIEGGADRQNKVIDYIKKIEGDFQGINIESIKGEAQCEFRISLGL